MGMGALIHVPLQVLRCGLGESLRRVGLVAVNVVVLNDAHIWQRTESLWTPLLAVLLFALEGISVVCHKGEFGDDWSSRFGLGPETLCLYGGN